MIIEEINEEEADHVVPDEDAYERNSPEMEAEADVDELWNGEAMPNMYTNDLIMDEMYNPIDHFGLKSELDLGGKRKQWMGEVKVNASKFSNMETGQSSGSAETKRQRSSPCVNNNNEDARVHEVTKNTTEVRGAVGPVPSLPP